MAISRAFKTDESFLEKIAMGATGTRKVFEKLAQNGHVPIELERGSRSFKIWKAIKIKRVGVPDILCVRCGRRIESRAKSKFEISMSHSFSDPERGWDAGLSDEDVVAFVLCSKSGEAPIDWKASDLVQYVFVKDLRNAWNAGLVKTEHRKGAEEGFEVRVTWPAIVASDNIIIEDVLPDRVRYRRTTTNRRVPVSLERQINGKQVLLQPLVSPGKMVATGQVLASVVPITTVFPCYPVANIIDTYITWIKSSSLADRYTAVKALCRFHTPNAIAALFERMYDEREHIYVRVDAAAGLMKRGEPAAKEFLASVLQNEYLENRLEAVIVLGEVATADAAELLIRTLGDVNQHPEIRAGAAWSLGEIGIPEVLPSLIESFKLLDNRVRIEAARALSKIARKHVKEVIKSFSVSEPAQRPGIAWALSKAGGFSISDLIPTLVDDDARQWISYIIGTQKRESMLTEIELLKQQDKEIYFAVTVLWKIFESWIWGLEEY